MSCFGGNDASVSVSASGGTPGYSYSWNTGATTSSISNLSAGSYACTVTDTNGCSVVVNVTITEPNAPLTASITSQNDVNCFGGNDANATITAMDGTAPYTYLWNTGVTTATISNLSAGTYTCTVTDANGCTFTLTTTIAQPNAPLVATITGQTNVTCNGAADGSAQAQASDGTAPYTYSWDNGINGSVNNNLAPGSYLCTVIDANGCITTESVSISEPSPLLVSISNDSSVCEGSSVTINASATGATPAYSYSWNHETNTTTSSTVTVNTDTSFTLVVTDANGCMDSATVDYTLLVLPLVEIGPDTIFLCPGVFTTDVFVTVDDTANLGYNTLWSTGATTDTINVGVGTYYVSVTDYYGCSTYTDSVVVDQQVILPIADAGATVIVCDLQSFPLNGTMTNAQNPLWHGGNGVFNPNNSLNTIYTPTSSDLAADSIYLFLNVESLNDCPGSYDSVLIVFGQLIETIDLQTTDISCFGENDGTVSAFVINGDYAPYMYSLDGQTPAGTNAYNNLTPGSHTITITNSLGCDTTLNFIINEPALLTLAIDTQINVSCFGGNNGSAQVIASGGTAPYSYSWNTGSNTNSISNVTAGTYTCTVTDTNGCTANVSVIITQPQPLANSFNFAPISCFGDSTTITSNVGGGTAPYNYVWNNSIIGNPIVVPAGSYHLIITDNNGCNHVDSITISQPSPLNLNLLAQTNVSCNGGNNGTATVSAVGGTAPYAYSWSNNLGNSATASNMSAGTYTCTVTDANGCQNNISVTITEPTPITNTVNYSPIQCYGMNTQVTATPSGGTPPYSYLWNGSSTANPISLNAGIHQLQITDGNGCVYNTTISITQPTQVQASIVNNTPVSCYGQSNGSLTAAGNGGTPGYTYSWSNGLGNDAIVDNLPAGTYTCTVTDQNGCTSTVTATITEPAPISNTFNFNPIQCFGGTTTIHSTVSGGTQPYSYIWNGQPNGSSLSTTAGNYTLQIIDANGCVLADNVSVTQPPQINASLPNGITVCAGTNTTLTVNPSGGTPGYTYTWNHDTSNNSPSSSVTITSDTTFSVVILDANNCGLQVYSNFNIYSFDPNDFNLFADQSGYCKGDTALLNYTYTGNAIINTVKWADCPSCVFPRPFQVNNDTTLYAYLLTHCGDTLWDSISLSTFTNPDIQIAMNDSIICPNEPILMTVFANSSTLGWQYQWYFEDELYSTSPTPFFNIGTPGFYQIDLNIVTQNGCNIWLEDAAAIQVNPKPYVDFTTDDFIHSMIDPTFEFRNLSIGAVSYLWNFGDGSFSTDIEPTHTYVLPEGYAVTLSGVNEFGCRDSITKTVRVDPQHTIFVPNTFTPDGDQYNDFFFAKHDGISKKGFEMTIFDRWGHVIFETTDPDAQWDGTYLKSDKIAAQGVYTWVIKYRDLGNTTHRLVGHVTLLK
ncbi:MAG: gliding motility-associated C-terminal domain-containing protein [Crocinitomicaceae bacterium]|nr:gliding motility-associated C-terminal domain-containing protein [Crocinitomicaceae bacterium]